MLKVLMSGGGPFLGLEGHQLATAGFNT